MSSEKPTKEEKGWIAAAAAFDDGRGLPLEECDPNDSDDMLQLYNALKVNDPHAKKRLNRLIRRLREPKEAPAEGKIKEQNLTVEYFKKNYAALKDIPDDDVNRVLDKLKEDWITTTTDLEAISRDIMIQKYPLLFVNAVQPGQHSAQRQRIMSEERKAILPMGEGASKFEGLHDRDLAREDLCKGLEYLAIWRGNRSLDKKKVPVLGISAPSESGKTEFLRWVFNECCSFNSDAGETAKNVLRRINSASPSNVQTLHRLLVLFASFSQQSTYMTGEGPIEVTTIERLVRSFEGTQHMHRFDADTAALQSWSDLVQMFSNGAGETGFVVCIDELSKVRQLDTDVHTRLVDSLLSFSQSTIANGGYFAFVGSSLHIYDFGEVVLQGSGRAMRQIKFSSNRDTMETKTKDFVLRSQVFSGAASRKDEQHFFLDVALQVARSSPHMSFWLTVANSRTDVVIPKISYQLPNGIDADYVFLLAARTALEQQSREAVNRDKLDAVLDKLHGSAELHDAEPDGVHLRWPNVSVTLSLPPWRLLQLIIPPHNQVFSHVQNWVLVELHRLFYRDGPSEAVTTWELALMGLLELRKAMLLVVRGQAPSLRNIVGEEVDALLKVSDDILEKRATEKTTANLLQDLPLGSDPCLLPCFHYTKKSNEEGIEGVFRSGFKDLSIFFQMKLYHKVTPMEIKNWLEKAHAKAQKLGYKEGTYIVQLFVTGMIAANVKKYYKA